MAPAPLFESAQAIQSLRDSDFDFQSAYGEVIDNSLEADAENVRILFDLASGKRGRKDIQAIAFGDDGYGMSPEVIRSCLTIGWSARYNDRNGIGRFGVGMTLAALHECKRVEVWSKEPGGDWLYTYIDVDEIEAGTMKEIPEPTSRKLPPEFKDLPGSTSGTLVIWRKYDRQETSAEAMIEEFRVWAGRTYRYFIWDAVAPRKKPLTITVQGETVRAIDPLYVRTDKTRFPEDPPARLFKEQVIKWPVDSNLPGRAGKKSTIVVRLSELPEEFRPTQGSGGSNQAKARFIHLNEGISILRNHREVFYGHIPHWKNARDGWPTFDDKDRWWGGEVLFSPEVDRAFQVKNIKRGAVPLRQLKLAIKDKIIPTRKTVLEHVDDLWSRNKTNARTAEGQAASDGLKRGGDHHEAEEVAKKTPVPKSQFDADKDLDKEIRDAASLYSDRYDEEEVARLANLFASQPFTIMETDWRGPQFYEPKFLGGNAVLEYNMRHVFWENVYGLVDSLGDDGVDDAEVAKDIRIMLDLLVISHAKAESMFSPDAEHTADEFIQLLHSNWGQYLSSYLRARTKEKERG